jgi:Tfp pilus assembly protein PilF
MSRAREYLSKALAIDPSNERALAMKASGEF